jgi:hypothetical protein
VARAQAYACAESGNYAAGCTGPTGNTGEAMRGAAKVHAESEARKAAEEARRRAEEEARKRNDCGFLPNLGCAAGVVGRAVVSVGGAVVQNTVAFVSDPVGYVSDHAADIAHAALGVATFIPGVGAVAALADAGLYVMAGDYGTAAMALAGAIPGGALVKMGGKAARTLVGADKAVNLAADVNKAERAFSGAEKFENVAGDVAGARGAIGRAERVGQACGLSFSPDTAVKTTTGEVAVSELRPGDTVLAYDPRTGETAAHTVTAVMVNLDPKIEHLALDTGTIETTPDHPVFTADRGWVLAGQLVIGEEIRTDSGHNATVLGFTIEATPTSMWDITVDGAHSFFVGSGAVLVHNADCGGGRVPRIEDPGSLAHSTLEEVDNAVPEGWVMSPTRKGGGVRWSDPKAPGNQVRAMPGDPLANDPLHRMPYVRVSLNGKAHGPIPIDW